MFALIQMPAPSAPFVFTTAIGWTIAAVALSAAVWLMLRARGWGAAAGWTALAFAGHACSLQLIEAGWHVRLLQFAGWKDLLRTGRGFFLAAVLAQALVVTWGTWRHLRPEIAVLRRIFSIPAMLGMFVLVAFIASTIAPEVAQAFVGGGFPRMAVAHATKIALGMMLLLVGAANLALIAATLPAEAWERMASRWRGRNTKALPWIAALWVVVVSSLLAWAVLERLPHVPDETVYLFHAKYFAAGKLYMPLPPDANSIYMPFTIADGQKWYSAVPPGWPAVLAIGVWLGVPWLMNPLMGGATVLLAHVLLRRLYDRDIADGAALLLAASPWLLYMSASMMTHGITLVLALVGLIGVERAREKASVAGGALAGLGIGALLNTRPLEAVIVAAAAGLWWLAGGWKKMRILALMATLVTGLGMTWMFLAYNKTLTGSATRVPLELWSDLTYYPGSNRLGFGKDVGNWGWQGLDALQGHGPIDVVMNTNHNLRLLNFEMFGWMCGSLLFVLLLAFLRRSRKDALMWMVAAATWAGMSLYWFSGGPDYGARYWYQMFVPLVALTMRGAWEYAAAWRENAPTESAAMGERVWAFVLLASVLGTVNMIPWRSLDKYYRYRGVRSDIRTLAIEHNFGRSLVFVRGRAWPDYAPAMALNAVPFDRDTPGTVYALESAPESNERVRNYYADRPVWIVAGTRLTGRPAAVIAGPIPPGQPLPVPPPATLPKPDER